MTFLYLVRHGETDWNRARRIQGSTNIPLNDTGREQARVAGRLLASRRWDQIVTSPLSRASETAEIIAAEVGLPAPTVMPSVVERNYGEAEGMTGEELSDRFPGDTPIAGRESRGEVAARSIPALIALAEECPEQSILVVSHGGVIRTILNEVGPADSPHHNAMISNGSIHSFHYSGSGLVLVAFDDPIEDDAALLGSEDFPEQNAAEGREP